MLDQQYFGSSTYRSFLDENFITFHAVRGEEEGDKLYDAFTIRATPTVLIITPEEREIDRVVGFGNSEDFQKELLRISQGVDTYAALLAAYEKDPSDLVTAFKLAQKYDETYDPAKSEKAAAIYEEIISNPEKAKEFTMPFGDDGTEIPLFEYANYTLGVSKMSMDYQAKPSDLIAFIEQFPDSKLLETACQRLGRYYSYNATAEEARPFFDIVKEKFPENTYLLNYYVQFCTNKKTDFEEGTEAAERMIDIEKETNPYHMSSYASLLVAKGDTATLNDVYGKDFISDKMNQLGYQISTYANFWIQQKDNLEPALEAVEILLKIKPDVPRYLSMAADLYMTMGKKDQALALYGPQYIKKKSDDDMALYYYASFWSRKKENLKSALKAAHRATEISSEPYYWAVVSRIYQAMDDYKEAIGAMEKAVDEAPETIYYQTQLMQLKEKAEKNK